ncbi:MAG: hypothetical protein HZA78_13295, partial [Candidatus Schekmanbacteria bacterium]|nr:hypothetical protein [Candidatus Schekmanbacteria bacterium]
MRKLFGFAATALFILGLFNLASAAEFATGFEEFATGSYAAIDLPWVK